MIKYTASLLLTGLLLTGCGAIEDAQQAVETAQQVVQTGQQIAETEVAKQLAQHLQQQYESSEQLRNAMFSGDGQLLVNELKNTELSNFSFYQSELLGLEFRGVLTGDGKMKVMQYNLTNPDEQPKVLKEFQILLDSTTGDIQVQ